MSPKSAAPVPALPHIGGMLVLSGARASLIEQLARALTQAQTLQLLLGVKNKRHAKLEHVKTVSRATLQQAVRPAAL